jgi:hypothetical protein
MEDSAYIGESIAGLLYLLVGVRLLRLALRTGEIPERLLCAGFLAWGFSYLLFNLPYMLADESLLTPLYIAARLVSAAAVITYALFAWRVFRRHDTWGGWAVAGTGVCLIAGVLGSVWVGDWEGVHPISNGWWWAEWVGATAAEAWMGAEAFVQFGKARQRLGLGLCNPLLCNRFLLLGVASLLWVALEFVVVVQSIEYEISHRWSATTDVVVAGVEVAAIAMIWLVFFPPAFYRSWIDGSTPVETSVKGR